jgi:endoglucanase
VYREQNIENNMVNFILTNLCIEGDIKMRDMRSIDLIKEFNNGWNLGNTLDATDPSLAGSSPDKFETAWGNPITTQEMIGKVKDGGFNMIRIPVTWGEHLGSAPSYKIEEKWFNRVQEVVDYAYDLDLYVILNLHHEEWHFPSNDNLEQAEKMLVKVWEQIAERFKDYNEHLIFEAMNEPRMKGTDVEWTGGTAEARFIINQLNATFLETIRHAAGNNPLRHVMLPTYAASADDIVLNDFSVPGDEKIIVSVHAYSPYDFALNEAGTDQWKNDNATDKQDIDDLFESLQTKFIGNDIAVIIGEYGARNKSNLSARINWAKYYVKCAEGNNVPRIWWDNGLFTSEGENFGLMNRRTLKWEYPEIVEAIMEVSK